MSSPTELSLRQLRKYGWTVAIVERFNPHARIRQDLYGFADILAVKALGESGGILAIQTTSGGHHNDHLLKLHREPRLWTWLQAGGKAELWSWTKSRHSGRWALRQHVFSLDTMPAQPAPIERRPRTPAAMAKPAPVQVAPEPAGLFANAGGVA